MSTSWHGSPWLPDQTSCTWEFRYDLQTLSGTTMDPYHQATFRKWNGAGRLREVTDGQGTTRFLYEADGTRLLALVAADGDLAYFQHDIHGNPSGLLMSNGNQVVFGYNWLNDNWTWLRSPTWLDIFWNDLEGRRYRAAYETCSTAPASPINPCCDTNSDTSIC